MSCCASGICYPGIEPCGIRTLLHAMQQELIVNRARYRSRPAYIGIVGNKVVNDARSVRGAGSHACACGVMTAEIALYPGICSAECEVAAPTFPGRNPYSFKCSALVSRADAQGKSRNRQQTH
jgi:hypothetical protein